MRIVIECAQISVVLMEKLGVKATFYGGEQVSVLVLARHAGTMILKLEPL